MDLSQLLVQCTQDQTGEATTAMSHAADENPVIITSGLMEIYATETTADIVRRAAIIFIHNIIQKYIDAEGFPEIYGQIYEFVINIIENEAFPVDHKAFATDITNYLIKRNIPEGFLDQIFRISCEGGLNSSSSAMEIVRSIFNTQPMEPEAILGIFGEIFSKRTEDGSFFIPLTSLIFSVFGKIEFDFSACSEYILKCINMPDLPVATMMNFLRLLSDFLNNPSNNGLFGEAFPDLMGIIATIFATNEYPRALRIASLEVILTLTDFDNAFTEESQQLILETVKELSYSLNLGEEDITDEAYEDQTPRTEAEKNLESILLRTDDNIAKAYIAAVFEESQERPEDQVLRFALITLKSYRDLPIGDNDIITFISSILSKEGGPSLPLIMEVFVFLMYAIRYLDYADKYPAELMEIFTETLNTKIQEVYEALKYFVNSQYITDYADGEFLQAIIEVYGATLSEEEVSRSSSELLLYSYGVLAKKLMEEDPDFKEENQEAIAQLLFEQCENFPVIAIHRFLEVNEDIDEEKVGIIQEVFRQTKIGDLSKIEFDSFNNALLLFLNKYPECFEESLINDALVSGCQELRECDSEDYDAVSFQSKSLNKNLFYNEDDVERAINFLSPIILYIYQKADFTPNNILEVVRNYIKYPYIERLISPTIEILELCAPRSIECECFRQVIELTSSIDVLDLKMYPLMNYMNLLSTVTVIASRTELVAEWGECLLAQIDKIVFRIHNDNTEDEECKDQIEEKKGELLYDLMSNYGEAYGEAILSKQETLFPYSEEDLSIGSILPLSVLDEPPENLVNQISVIAFSDDFGKNSAIKAFSNMIDREKITAEQVVAFAQEYDRSAQAGGYTEYEEDDENTYNTKESSKYIAHIMIKAIIAGCPFEGEDFDVFKCLLSNLAIDYCYKEDLAIFIDIIKENEPTLEILYAIQKMICQLDEKNEEQKAILDKLYGEYITVEPIYARIAEIMEEDQRLKGTIVEFIASRQPSE